MKTFKKLVAIGIVAILLVGIYIYTKPIKITIPSEKGVYELEIRGNNVNVDGRNFYNVKKICKTYSENLVILERNGELTMMSKDGKFFLISKDVKDLK